MAISSFNVLSLCAGIGGLDLGVHIAVPEARTVCYLEREAFAAEKLAEKIESGAFAEAPIYSDLETFDGRAWRGVVDCIVAGLPCQPYSVAGKRQGEADERYIWPEFFRILREVRPAVVFLENVSAFIQYFRPLGEELSGMGYEFEAGLFTAAEVGATHRRKRFFCLAYSGLSTVRKATECKPKGPGDDHRCGKELAHAGRRGSVADPERGGGRQRAEISQGREPLAIDGSTFPPGPADHAAWGRILAERPELAPALADRDEGGLSAARSRVVTAGVERDYRPQEETEPAIRGVADGNADPLANRVDKLRAYGNAVVPLTAARAFEVLAGRIRV